jgi:hypothetical protein
MFFNGVLRPMIEGYLNLCLSCFTSADNMSFEDTQDIINAFVTMALFLVLISIPFVVFVFLKKFQSRLELPHIKRKFGSLYDGIDTQRGNTGIF